MPKSALSRNILRIAFICVLLFACALAGYFAYKYKALLNSQPGRSDERIVKELGEHVELPDETPSIALVTDVSKLANRPLFAHGQNGDKLIIYTKAGKAYLYRPSTKKLIDIGPVQTTEATSSPELDSTGIPSPEANSSPSTTKKSSVIPSPAAADL